MRSFATFVSSIARGLCLRGAFTSIFTITFAVVFVPFLAGCGGGGSTGGGVQQSTQTITFTQPTSPVVYASGLTVSLSATGGGSGNPVIFTVDSTSTGKGTVSGNTLTVTAAGKLVVDANQAGNSNYYAASQVSVTVVVNPATSTVSVWPTANAITAGQALSASILIGGTASVPGVFAWTTPSTVPAAGTDLENVTFTPTDNVDYTTVIGSVPVVVNPAVKTTPTINWPTPAAITSGTALSSTQLNATATANGSTIVGTFVYTPAAGTVPAVGTDALSVAFTPNDITDYTTATASVQIVVNPATPQITSITPRYFTADGFSYFVNYNFLCAGCVNGDILHTTPEFLLPDGSILNPDLTLPLAPGATGFGLTLLWEEGTFEPVFLTYEIQHPGGSYGNQWGTASFGTGSQSTIVVSPTTGTIFQLEGINGLWALPTGGTKTLIVSGLSTSPTTIAVDDGGDLVTTGEMTPGPVLVLDETGNLLCRLTSGMASLSSVSAKGGHIFFTDPTENKVGIAGIDCSGYQTIFIPWSPWVVSATSSAAYVLARDKASANGLPLVTKISHAGVPEGSVELTGFTPKSTVIAANPYQGLYSLVTSNSAPMAVALSTSDNSVLIINTDSMTVTNTIKIPADEIPFQIVLQESPAELFVGYILANGGESVTHIGSINLASGNYNPNAGTCAPGILANFLAINNEAICAQGGVIEPPVALQP